VSTHEEWYIWESSFFTDDVSNAFHETGKLTVMLRSGFLIDQTGFVIFYPNAKLEVEYTPETLPPVVADIIRQPNSPTSNDDVNVNVSVADDESGVSEVNLFYSIDEGKNWIKTMMSHLKGSVYNGTIPKQDNDTTVQYYVEAFDNAGNSKKSSQHFYTITRAQSEEEQRQVLSIFLSAIMPFIFILVGILIVVAIVIVYIVIKSIRTRKTAPKVSLSQV